MELPLTAAAEPRPYLTYGSLVTVSPQANGFRSRLACGRRGLLAQFARGSIPFARGEEE